MGKTLLICLTCLLLCSTLVAVLLGICSGLLNFVFHKVLEQEISKRMTLVEGHASYEQLQSPSIPTFKSLYFLNLTNPEAFEEGTAKAVLEEVGPYSYGELRLKNFSTTEDKSKLSYTNRQYYFYSDYGGSNLSESDVICTINIPLMVGVYAVLDIPEYQKPLKYLINITSAQLYTCQNVSGLVWGYTDPFLQKLHDLGLSPVEKMWLMSNGSSSSGTNTIHTGVGDISSIGQFLEWNGHKEYLDVWPSPKANHIHGTEGVFFKPNLEFGDPLTLFVGDLMRAFELQNTAVVNHLGMDALRYRFHSSIFEGAFTNPDSAQWESWCPDGLFYLGPLKDPKVPLYGSKPHFLGGASSLLDGVYGLNPSWQQHDSHIDVEPNLGVNVDFSMQIQLNVRVNTSAHFSFLENLQGVDSHGSLFMPVLYINEHAEFSQDLKNYLDDSGLERIRKLENVVTLLFYVLIGVAAASALISMAAGIGVIWNVLKLKYHKEDEMKPLLDTDFPAAIANEYLTKRRSREEK